MTDQQFLAQMWQKVDALEHEEREILRAKQRDAALRRGAIQRALIIAVLLLVMLVLFWLGLDAMVVPLPILAAAFIAENNKGKSKEPQTNE